MFLLSWVASNVLLALVLVLAAAAARRVARPAVAHVLCVLALVKLLTPPLVVVPLSPPPCPCDRGRSEGEVPWVVFGVWAVGAGATAWVARRRWSRFRRLLAHARPAPVEWQSRCDRLAAELSVRCRPRVLVVPGRFPPMVVPGRDRPSVLLPAELLEPLNDTQRDALLLHELAHVRRGDHFVRLLELAVAVAYWWLPGVGAIGRRLRACEEACCDAAVVTHLPGARRAYAGLLLDVIDFADGDPIPQPTAMSGAAADLERRLRAILAPAPRRRRRAPFAWLVACGLACATLPCGLHYDFAIRTPVPVPEAHEPAAEDAAPRGNRGEWVRSFACCPS